jgi:hypothetical protein
VPAFTPHTLLTTFEYSLHTTHYTPVGFVIKNIAIMILVPEYIKEKLDLRVYIITICNYYHLSERQHLLLSYFKTLSVGLGRI